MHGRKGLTKLPISWEVGEVEEAHEKRFLKLLENLRNGEVFKKKRLSVEMPQLRLHP